MKPIDVPLCDLAFLLIKYSTWTLSSSLIYWPFTIVLWQVARYPYKGTLLRSWRLDGKFFFFFFAFSSVDCSKGYQEVCLGKIRIIGRDFDLLAKELEYFIFGKIGLMFEIWTLDLWSLNLESLNFEVLEFKISDFKIWTLNSGTILNLEF